MSTVASSSRAAELSAALGKTRRLPSSALLVEPGPLDIESLIPRGQCAGLLVLDGLIAAELEAGRARVAWLLGADDLIIPREMNELTLTRPTRWRALTDAAVLPIAGTGTHPRIAERLLARAAHTGHQLLAQTLILSAPLIEERLLLLFAHYAERWGKVTPRGIRLDMPLTHELLATLAGARRPTVTLAIGSLTKDGFLERLSSGRWLLLRDPARNGHLATRSPDRDAAVVTSGLEAAG